VHRSNPCMKVQGPSYA